MATADRAQPRRRPGDVVHGRVLTVDGRWVPVTVDRGSASEDSAPSSRSYFHDEPETQPRSDLARVATAVLVAVGIVLAMLVVVALLYESPRGGPEPLEPLKGAHPASTTLDAASAALGRPGAPHRDS